MQTVASPMQTSGFTGWLQRAEAFLDDKGKGAWIAAMVVSFIVFWPLGLALLAYMIWSKKMICNSARRKSVSIRKSSGNSAFDAYKADTLRRLEQEQDNFEAFLQRLRDARDKAEFDQFMEERAKAASGPEQDMDDQPRTREV